MFSRVLTKLNTAWMRAFYRFSAFGAGVSIHYTCEVARRDAPYVELGDRAYLAPQVWLNVEPSSTTPPKIAIGANCRIGRRSVISARNQIRLENDVLLAPGVLLMDHNHDYRHPALPIHAQGITAGGTILIERNCWIGFGAVVCCGDRDLVVGRNSVIGANAVVTRSVPPHSVVAGNPARVIREYDAASGQWERVSSMRQLGQGAG